MLLFLTIHSVAACRQTEVAQRLLFWGFHHILEQRSHLYLHSCIHLGTSCPLCPFLSYSAFLSAQTMLHSAWCCFGSLSLGCMNDRIWRTNIMSGICQMSVTVPADLCCFLASMWFSTHLNSQLHHWCPCCPAAVCTVLSVGTPLCACVWRNMFRQDVTVSVISFNSIWVK